MAGADSKSSNDNTLDTILAQLGDFGRYQILIFSLFSLAVIIQASINLSFVFTAKNPGYRCHIPQCDDNSTSAVFDYNPSWLANAVPYTDGKPEPCKRFMPYTIAQGHCEAMDFNRDYLTDCDNGYVYDTEKISIVNDFEIHCEDNTWKLTMIGTFSNVGLFIGLPIAGFLSDRYGRKTVFVWGIVLGGLTGIVKSFSTNYIMFVFFEFLGAAIMAGTLPCGFTLSLELLSPARRAIGGTMVTSFYAFGEVALALLAWWITSWRTLLLASSCSSLFILIYLWITPESVRWLLSKGRFQEAKAVLHRVATFNNKTISEEDLNQLMLNKQDAPRDSLAKIFKSRTLLLRFISCSYCWITCTFLFYGLTLNSVSLAEGNSYLDFILTALVEIPASVVICVAVERVGRRILQCCAFWITAISSLVFIFADDSNYYLHLFVYLLGKFGATASIATIYIITSEIFPTPMRQSMMAACSMIGRIGSMISPQLPLLEQAWKPLPLVLFTVMATIAGFTCLLLPETLRKKLPDTIEEAENIGKAKDPKQ